MIYCGEPSPKRRNEDLGKNIASPTNLQGRGSIECPKRMYYFIDFVLNTTNKVSCDFDAQSSPQPGGGTCTTPPQQIKRFIQYENHV